MRNDYVQVGTGSGAQPECRVEREGGVAQPPTRSAARVPAGLDGRAARCGALEQQPRVADSDLQQSMHSTRDICISQSNRSWRLEF